MKNLARHIELLLRDNDCVILPGFGGFIAHNIPANYDRGEGVYYPPTRNISFNAAITMNDGLLAQSYMKSYQVDYARANYMIDIAVEQLTDTLDEEGQVTLPHIGTISLDINQTLKFNPVQSGIASPAHFGLSLFFIKEISQLQKGSETSLKDKQSVAHSAKTIDIHINKEILHRVLSTAAIFLLLLLVSLPTGDYQPTDIAALHLSEIISPTKIEVAETHSVMATETISESSDTMQPIATTSVSEEPSIATEPTLLEISTDISTHDLAEVSPVITESPINDTPVPVALVETQLTKTYHIIVASLPNHRGADETLEQYINQGYAEATLVERDNRVRISLIQFTDKNEANEYLKSLRQNDKFKSAWLLAVRN